MVLALVCLLATSCVDSDSGDTPHYQTLRLAATSSTVQSGLVDALVTAFTSESGIPVELSVQGSGEALDAARSGRADVVLVHSRRAEDQFIESGYGLNRRGVMYNEFYIAGPESDPAQISGLTDSAEAFKRIVASGQPFFSRADNSGTHVREKQVWNLTGFTPGGDWYRMTSETMLPTLEKASSAGGYVFCDSSTFIANMAKLNLKVLVKGDPRLRNSYSVIAVNPQKIKGTRFKEADAFISFLASERGRTTVRDFGREQFGQPLFHLEQ